MVAVVLNNTIFNLIFLIIYTILISLFIFLAEFGILNNIINYEENTGNVIEGEFIYEDNSVKIEFVYFIPENIQENDIIEFKVINIEKLDNN